MNQRNVFRRALAAVISTFIVLFSAMGCGTYAGHLLAHAEQVATSCPTNGSGVADLVEIDWSGSSRAITVRPAHREAIRDIAERTAICGGHLRVVLFAGSMLGAIVFDGELQLEGATATARLRKAPKVVDDVMDQLNGAWQDASAQLNDGATDIVGQYQHGAEYGAQLSATGSYELELTILTDGIQTAGQDLGDPALTIEHAELLAATFTVPDLSGATVRLIGVGRQANGAPLPTPYIAALRAFHTAVCERTQATCTVVTDAAGS